MAQACVEKITCHFLPKSRFQTLIFHFFCTCETFFFNFILNNLKSWILWVFFFVLPRRQLLSLAQARSFWEKKWICYLMTLIESSNGSFSFVSYFKQGMTFSEIIQKNTSTKFHRDVEQYFGKEKGGQKWSGKVDI